MATQFIDSQVYGGAWGTPELRAIFEEEARSHAVAGNPCGARGDRR